MQKKLNNKTLTPKQLESKIWKRLKRIDKLNFLESYAVFMGKVQIIEMALKNILINKYKYEEDRIEKWTLDGLIRELKRLKLRGDFTSLLEELKDYRNYIAHDLLADYALMKKLFGTKADRLSWKRLRQGLFIVEKTIQVHDFLMENTNAK